MAITEKAEVHVMDGTWISAEAKRSGDLILIDLFGPSHICRMGEQEWNEFKDGVDYLISESRK